MKKYKKILGIALVAFIMVVAYVWFFVYNKPHRNIEKAKADYELSAEVAYHTFHSGDPVQAKEYQGKVIQLTGQASHIESGDSLMVLVFVFEEGMFGDEGIRCSFLPKYNQQLASLDLSKEIIVKGYCAGYNETDVIMEQCSLAGPQ